MGNAAYEDIAVIGIDFSSDISPVLFAANTEILITFITMQRRHGFHPKVIQVRAEGMHGLFEGDLNLEAKPIEFNNGQSIKINGGTKQDDIAPWGMHNQY